MRYPAVATRDRVLAYILAHIEKHGRPPLTKVVAADLGINHQNVARATARLIVERRLLPEQRNPRGAQSKRDAEIAAMRRSGLSKPAVAKALGLSPRQVGRIFLSRAAG